MTRRAGQFSFAGEDRRRARWPWGWLLLALLSAAAATAGWWYFNPGSMPGVVADLMPSHGAATTTLYRWRDAGGEWVIADRPPTDGTPYEEVTVRQDTNVLPPVDSERD